MEFTNGQKIETVRPIELKAGTAVFATVERDRPPLTMQTDIQHKLDLRAISSASGPYAPCPLALASECAAAVKAFRDGDGGRFAICAYSTGGTLAIVFDNQAQLQARGIYEEALVSGYCGCKTNHRGWDMSVIEGLFQMGDRDKLRAVGSPLPGAGPFVLYRGVGRQGRERQVRGMSWTASLDVACWFALRGYCDPAVYTAKVRSDDIYCYYNKRHEEEYICLPKRPKRLEIQLNEMEERAARYRQRQG